MAEEVLPHEAAGPGRVEAVQTQTIRLSLDPALAVHGARSKHLESEFVLVRVVTSTGAYGYGEVSATRMWSGEDALTATHVINDVLAPVIVGEPVIDTARLSAKIRTALARNPFTKAGVTTALWDAFGRSVGLPLAVLLGGPYRTHVPVKMSLSGDGDRLEACYAAAVAKGFGAFKVKVGKGLAMDLQRMRHARQLVGDDTFLGLDANGGWTPSEARAGLRLAHELNFAMVEQPTAAGDLASHRDLRGLIPVILDESVYDEADLTRTIRSRAADAVSLYVGKSGGPDTLVHMARTASQFGLDVVIGSNAEFGIAAAAMTHAAAACPTLGATPSDIIGQHFYTEDILATPLDIDGRFAALPAGPGLGVELREDLEARFR